jgi:MFS family permease
MARKFLEENSITRKDFFIVSILLVNAFVWHYLTLMMINNILTDLNVTSTENFAIWTVYYTAIIASSIIGSILSNKTNRLNFIYFWMILGVVSSPLPILINISAVLPALIISILWGTSFGIGMPSCLAYFADHTRIEKRGRKSGIIWLITNLSAPLLMILFGMFNLIVNLMIFTLWRASGLLIFFLNPKKKFVSEAKKNGSFSSIFHDKSFILYFIAWFMFMFIERSEAPVIRFFLDDLHYPIIAPIIGSFSALIGGIVSDWIGRKRMVLYGFIAFGIAYAMIGIAPDALFSRYFFLIVESISTGIFLVTFVLILWGDLSKPGTKEKYYAIGEIPLFLTMIIQLLLGPYFMAIPNTSAFSLASVFLFLAVLPLLYAPETLPEKKIRLRRLRKYMDTAKKVKEKYTKKGR